MPQERNAHLSRAMRGELQAALGYVTLTEERSVTEDAGDFNSGAWRQRQLNTVHANTVGAVTITLADFTLPRGIYEVRGSAPAHQVDAHQCRLYDLTNSAVLLVGTSEQAPAGTAVVTRSVLLGRIYVEDDTEMRYEHRCETTRVTDGMGAAAGWGTEVYAELEFRRVR